jgi:antitoxin YefM
MNAIHIHQLRDNLPQTLDKVCHDHEPIIITRDEGDEVVILSYADYSALEETGYLLRSPVMAKRLRDSLASFYNEGGIERNLIEEE